MPNPKRRHSKARGPPSGARPPAGPEPERVPELPRAQAAAPRVCALRPLQGQGGRRGRGSLSAATARVVVDALGGDHGVSVVVEGAVQASRRHGVVVSLVGPERLLRDAVAKQAAADPALEIVDAPDAVGMGEKVSLAALRKRSSIQVALERVRDGRADAFGRQHRGLLDDRAPRARHARGRPAGARRRRADPLRPVPC